MDNGCMCFTGKYHLPVSVCAPSIKETHTPRLRRAYQHIQANPGKLISFYGSTSEALRVDAEQSTQSAQ